MLGYPWIHADGILSHLQREHEDEQFYNLPSKQVVPFFRPGKRFFGWVYGEEGQSPFPIASVYIPAQVTVTVLYKRFETTHLEILRSRKAYIDIAKGKMRNWALKYVICSAPVLEFRVLTDRTWLEERLSTLTHIGKKRVAGYGEVRSIEVERLSSCWQVLFDEDGRLLRQIPAWAADSPDTDQLFWGIPRPPYWDKSLLQYCVKPGERVRLVQSVVDQLERYDAQAR